jgi:hypothetical protein
LEEKRFLDVIRRIRTREVKALLALAPRSDDVSRR